MATSYSELKELEEIAAKVILYMGWEIEQPKIKYLILEADRSSYLGRCTKASEKWKFITGLDFIIEVWQKAFESMTDKQREAIVLHELTHIICKEDKEGNTKWGLQKHDVEEFCSVVAIYGAWEEPLKVMLNALNHKEKVVDKEAK